MKWYRFETDDPGDLSSSIPSQYSRVWALRTPSKCIPRSIARCFCQIKSLSDLVREASVAKSMASDTVRVAGKRKKSRIKARRKKQPYKRIPMPKVGPAGVQETAICLSALPVARCDNYRSSTAASVSGRGLKAPGGVKRIRLSDPLPPEAAREKGSGQKDGHQPDAKPRQGYDEASARSRSPPREQDTKAEAPSEESRTSRFSTSVSGGELPGANLDKGDSGKRRSRASGSRRRNPSSPVATSVGGGPNEQPTRAKPRGEKNRRTLQIQESSADDVVTSEEPSERLRSEDGEHRNAEGRGNEGRENRRGAEGASNAAVRRAKWLQAVEENDKRLKAEDERLHLERERIRKERLAAKEAHVARSVELMQWMVDEQGGKHDNLGIEGPAASEVAR